MGKGTFEAKFIPLSKLSFIEKIYIVRDKVGPNIDKVEYIVLPRVISRFKPLKIFIPFIIAKHTIQKKCGLIIGYHIVPHAFFAFVASLLSRTPFACAQTGIYIQRQSQNKIFGFFLKEVLRKALFINVPGQMSRDFWFNFGLEPSKINILHSTIDTYRFSNNNLEKVFDFIILSRLSEEKRIEHLLNIFHKMKSEGHNFTVCIAGDGPRAEYLKALTDELNLGDIISFVGFVDNPEVWFNKSKIFLLSSQSEGFPTALMQAMSCGLVCVSTNVGNISDTIVQNQNGFLVDYGNWGGYKDILIQLLEKLESTEFKKIADKAREDVVKNHSIDFAIREWEKVFKNYFTEK